MEKEFNVYDNLPKDYDYKENPLDIVFTHKQVMELLAQETIPECINTTQIEFVGKDLVDRYGYEIYIHYPIKKFKDENKKWMYRVAAIAFTNSGKMVIKDWDEEVEDN